MWAMTVRTRFAPSPTGFIHLGNLRSALYPWAFARKMQGDFILRIEDTDQERSSQEAVDVIIEGMRWLGLDIDEGPIYQMQRMDRYREVIAQMLNDGLAYYCYMSEEELNALREQQMANKEKPRYNGFWRPEPGKNLPTPSLLRRFLKTTQVPSLMSSQLWLKWMCLTKWLSSVKPLLKKWGVILSYKKCTCI